uniref:RabBD domain-containing protein n=2 Tax=Ciona savignyi TaxID=51511 RepID=H2ZP75_CIOSA
MEMLHLEDWEREAILRVLKRQRSLQEIDERRINQLAVRVQLQRINDTRSTKLENELKTKTGKWHQELLRRRCPSAVYEPPETMLLRRLSSETRSLDGATSFTGSTPTRVNSLPTRGRNYSGTNLDDVREWVENCHNEADFADSVQFDISPSKQTNNSEGFSETSDHNEHFETRK